jgi:hypothetical protein
VDGPEVHQKGVSCVAVESSVVAKRGVHKVEVGLGRYVNGHDGHGRKEFTSKMDREIPWHLGR